MLAFLRMLLVWRVWFIVQVFFLVRKDGYALSGVGTGQRAYTLSSAGWFFMSRKVDFESRTVVMSGMGDLFMFTSTNFHRRRCWEWEG
jgi:hypothetical protein